MLSQSQASGLSLNSDRLPSVTSLHQQRDTGGVVIAGLSSAPNDLIDLVGSLLALVFFDVMENNKNS